VSTTISAARTASSLAAAAAVAALAVLAGCTRVSTGSVGPNAGNPWTVHRVLRIAGRQEPDNLNTLLGTQSVDTDLSMFWGGHLFNWSDRDELVPELAERVPTLHNGGIGRDGLTITYHLRRGVLWHDGAPFGADDVIYTWQQVMNPRNFVVSRSGYDLVTRIDKVDDATIAVHLRKRFAPFVAFFFTMSTQPFCVLPKHLLAQYQSLNRVSYNTLPVGTGPFRVAAYEKGQFVRFAANERYWRGPPKLKRIDFRIIPNDNTILTLLRTHEIDFYYRASETQAPSLRSIPGTRVVITPFTRFTDIGLNASAPALSDVRVRRALAYATDRAALVEKVTHGVAQPGDSTQPSFFWAYDPNVRKYPYDPRRAAALLDEAGWHVGPDGVRVKDGRPLRLTMVGFTGSATVTESQALLQQEWREAGIDVSIKNFSTAQLYATLAMGGIEQSGKFDVAFENWSNGTDPDDSILFACSMAPPAGWNIYHICNPALDAAYRTGLSTYDRAARKAAYDSAQEIIAEELPIIVLWYQRQFDVMNADFTGYRPAHAVTPFWNTWEWSI
jgi:peptide/nickel transport system substrate-binding protein